MSLISDPAVLEKAKEQQKVLLDQGIEYHQHQFCHFSGRPHCMEEAADLYAGMAKCGFGIDGSSIGFLNVTASDLTVVPDPDTFRIGQGPDGKFGYSWSWLYGNDNRPHPLCVRSCLKRVVDKANAMGFVPEMFGELEFYLFKEDGSYFDLAGYTSMPPEDKGVVYRHRLGRMMLEAGVQPKRLHHECGPGQNEIELKFQPALKNGDDMVRGMYLAKLLAAEYGLKADFMPKPVIGIAGNGLHEHTILRNSEGVNMFSGPHDGLSDTALHFIAGQLKYARDIGAVFAMSDQSFERLKPGFEAPIYAAWDFANRSSMVRVPKILPGTENKTRIEYRAGDGSGSPHLLSAMMLGAGLKGIEMKLPCPARQAECDFDHLTQQEAADLGIEMLPKTLEESLEVLRGSAFCREILGEPLVQALCRLKEKAIAARKH